jgi:hypothetical protein
MTTEPRVHVFETEQPPALSVELSNGVINVVAGERSDTVVTLRPTDSTRPQDVAAAEGMVVEMVGGTVLVRDPRVRGLAWHLVGWKRSGSVVVTIEAPEGSSLRADTGVADFRCEGALGDVDLKAGVGSAHVEQARSVRVRSGTGDVSVEEASGRAELVTAGDMIVGTVAGDAEVKNLNGRTRIGRIGGSLRVRSANGEIVVEEAGGDVDVKTANGEIRLGQIVRGTSTIQTAMGAIEIGIREGSAAWLDANTKYGRVNNELMPAAEPVEPTETVRVHATTSFGDIRITRS